MSGGVSSDVALWLRKHGKCVPQKLGMEARQEMRETFSLMDSDGIGKIDTAEMGHAFRLLGAHARHMFGYFSLAPRPVGPAAGRPW
jgi:hypothetical protein